MAKFESRFGPDAPGAPRVVDRFLEKGDDYKAAFLRDWIEKYPDAARHYAFPVLFPVDLLFMAALGGFLCLASFWCGASIASVKPVSWLFVILPAAYVAADIAEDTLLARFLTNPAAVDERSVALAHRLTKSKIALCGLGIAQTVILSAWAAVAS